MTWACLTGVLIWFAACGAFVALMVRKAAPVKGEQ